MDRRQSGERLTLTPSEVRVRILEEHRQLRKRLLEVQDFARATALDESFLPQLRASARALIVEFATHLDSEEEILVPVVEDITGYGPALAARMLREHEQQRAELRAMFEKTESPQRYDVLAEQMDTFVLTIFKDMREEEQAVLREDVLRDDVIAVDQFCG